MKELQGSFFFCGKYCANARSAAEEIESKESKVNYKYNGGSLMSESIRLYKPS